MLVVYIFKPFEMAVKNVSSNEYIMEEVYVEQILGFEDKALQNHVYKLNKVLYCLKQVAKV